MKHYGQIVIGDCPSSHWELDKANGIPVTKRWRLAQKDPHKFKGNTNHVCASFETQNLQNLNEKGKILLQDGYSLNTFCENSK